MGDLKFDYNRKFDVGYFFTDFEEKLGQMNLLQIMNFFLLVSYLSLVQREDDQVQGNFTILQKH